MVIFSQVQSSQGLNSVFSEHSAILGLESSVICSWYPLSRTANGPLTLALCFPFSVSIPKIHSPFL